METCFVNLVEPGDRVLILINGVFGQRMQDVATRLGARVDTIDYPWGEPVDPQDVSRKLKENDYKIVAVVHAETSTGVKNPVAAIGDIVRSTALFILVDTVTSLGGIDVEVDDWHIDAVYSGTQKCLSCPPGLSPVSFSQRAVDAIESRQTKVPNWYLDLSLILSYWQGETRTYHHTAPINMIYALHQSLGAHFRGRTSRLSMTGIYSSIESLGEWSGEPGTRNAGVRTVSSAHVECSESACRNRRGGRSQETAPGAQNRNRRRSGPAGRKNLANRTHGSHGTPRKRLTLYCSPEAEPQKKISLWQLKLPAASHAGQPSTVYLER